MSGDGDSERNAADARSLVEIFCDGSCSGNPGPGGWAALLRRRRGSELSEKELTGGAAQTTNNRMELTAALEGLRALTRPCRVEVITDSNYVVQGMTTWIHGWMKKGWMNSQRKPVENQDLWRALQEAAAAHEVRWRWVRGHDGHVENERVDVLARNAATQFAKGAR